MIKKKKNDFYILTLLKSVFWGITPTYLKLYINLIIEWTNLI